MKNFGDEKEAPCNQGRGHAALDAEQREKLTKACFDFAIRVLAGKETTPQETAALPEVLNFMRASNTEPYFNFGSSTGNE